MPMSFLDRGKALLRGFLIRTTLVLAGCAIVAVTISLNLNAGPDILAGLVAPDDPRAMAVSVARLLAPALGLWLVYRGLR